MAADVVVDGGGCLRRILARLLAVVVRDLRQMSVRRNDDLERSH